jgi:hypothetical protein
MKAAGIPQHRRRTDHTNTPQSHRAPLHRAPLRGNVRHLPTNTHSTSRTIGGGQGMLTASPRSAQTGPPTVRGEGDGGDGRQQLAAGRQLADALPAGRDSSPISATPEAPARLPVGGATGSFDTFRGWRRRWPRARRTSLARKRPCRRHLSACAPLVPNSPSRYVADDSPGPNYTRLHGRPASRLRPAGQTQRLTGLCVQFSSITAGLCAVLSPDSDS